MARALTATVELAGIATLLARSGAHFEVRRLIAALQTEVHVPT